MKEYVYAIGDIHGQIAMFRQLMRDYDHERHQLVLIGDLNDRGKNSKECFLLGKELVEKYDAIYLRGNHEEMFLQFIMNPEDWFPNYVYNGGKETLESLLHSGATEEYSPTEMSLMIQSHYPDLLDFLTQRPLYYEWKNYIFVHAGIDLTKKDWKETRPDDFIWIREPFFQGKNQTGKTIVFGHTITPMLHGDMKTTDLWLSDNKIGMDGGGIYGGSIHGIVFGEKGILQDIEIQNTSGPWKPSF